MELARGQAALFLEIDGHAGERRLAGLADRLVVPDAQNGDVLRDLQPKAQTRLQDVMGAVIERRQDGDWPGEPGQPRLEALAVVPISCVGLEGNVQAVKPGGKGRLSLFRPAKRRTGGDIAEASVFSVGGQVLDGLLRDACRVVVEEDAKRIGLENARVWIVRQDCRQPCAAMGFAHPLVLDAADEQSVKASGGHRLDEVGRQGAARTNELHVPVVAFAEESVNAVQLLAPRRAVHRHGHEDTESALLVHGWKYIKFLDEWCDSFGRMIR